MNRIRTHVGAPDPDWFRNHASARDRVHHGIRKPIR